MKSLMPGGSPGFTSTYKNHTGIYAKQNFTDLESGSVRQLLWMQQGVKIAEGTQKKCERGRATFANNGAHFVDLITKRYSKRGTERHCTLDNYNKFQTLLR